MTTTNSTDKNSNFESPLELSDKLKSEGIIQKFVKNTKHNYIKIQLNHKYENSTVIISTVNIKDWGKFHESVKKMLNHKRVYDQNHIKLITDVFDDNHEVVIENDNNNIVIEDEKTKREFVTFKHSQMGKGDLYESVFIDGGLPVFIKYNDKTNEFEKTEQKEETTRILVPPTLEECACLPYEFESLDEINSINKFIENNHIDFDYLYYKGYEIVSKYNNQSKPKLRLATIKIITFHFQDRFPTTEYLSPVGGNGSGKSSIAETFRAIAYRAVVMTDPSAPNLFRVLGVVEPVQCTMVLEEADKIDKSLELMAVLKTGYSWYGMVPKINPYTLKQEFFFTYCPKIIVSERSLNQSVAKGVSSRTFPINCIKGSTKHDIKEVLNPTNKGGPENKKLLDELMDFRKLLLVYRLRHFKDPIPDLDIGVEGRDKELVKHSIQLFYGCKCLKEVTETLQQFLDRKNKKKESSVESILLSRVSTLVKHNGPEISSKSIWNELMEEIPGILNEKNPNEYHTDDYGTIFRTTTVSDYLGDSFGGRVEHKRTGNVWIFDRETIERLVKEDNTRITISESKTKKGGDDGEGVNTVNTPDRGGSIKLEKSGEGEGENNTKNPDPPSPDAFTPFTPSHPDYDNIINNQEEKQEQEESLTIHRRSPHSDIWVCDCCNWTGDIHFMKKHPCKHNKIDSHAFQKLSESSESSLINNEEEDEI